MSVVTIGVFDLDRSQEFYERGLGWALSVAEGRIRFFQLNGLILALYPLAALAEDAQVSSSEKGFSGITLAYCARSREEVNEILVRAEGAGATITKAAQSVFWGGYSGYFSDPDGHLWEVAHNPFWELDDVGNVYLQAP